MPQIIKNYVRISQVNDGFRVFEEDEAPYLFGYSNYYFKVSNQVYLYNKENQPGCELTLMYKGERAQLEINGWILKDTMWVGCTNNSTNSNCSATDPNGKEGMLYENYFVGFNDGLLNGISKLLNRFYHIAMNYICFEEHRAYYYLSDRYYDYSIDKRLHAVADGINYIHIAENQDEATKVNHAKDLISNLKEYLDKYNWDKNFCY